MEMGQLVGCEETIVADDLPPSWREKQCDKATNRKMTLSDSTPATQQMESWNFIFFCDHVKFT